MRSLRSLASLLLSTGVVIAGCGAPPAPVDAPSSHSARVPIDVVMPAPVVVAEPAPAPAAARESPPLEREVDARPVLPLEYEPAEDFDEGDAMVVGHAAATIPSAVPMPVPTAKPPQLRGETMPACPFPPEAGDIDTARVVLVVTVDVSGAPTNVRIVSDPGSGFGRAARDCLMQARFVPAVDEHGRSVHAQSPPVVVRFVR